MKKLVVAILTILSMNASAQNISSRFDARFGVGTSLLSTGDMHTVMFENELNYRLNNFLTAGASVGFGRSSSGTFETSSFVQGNLNVFLSPFKNGNRNDFRIGTGISCMNGSDAYLESASYENGTVVEEVHRFDNRTSIGLNIMLENTYTVREKFMVGLKLFTQPYANGDINSGLLLKLGCKL